ncbi:hypothetical protein [uncultured Roseovarius sp.]|uniref:hypothetical protein n=1 Tax=uncultured Roseovarius sp. TaxID=293344 RepID=UPI0026077006|nr:hypothetical protein [uncultured Roseovarius sp.]
MGTTLKDFVQQNKVVIHLGAHKTATTYIQSSLKAQRDALKSAGVALVLPSDLRATGVLRRTFRKSGGAISASSPDPDKPTLGTLLDRIAADPATRRIAISEESMIGAPRKNLACKSLYPDMDQSLRAMPDAFDHPNATFLLALRDYGSFVSSNITTAVRRGNIFDLDALRAAFLALHRDWMDVIDDLQEAFPTATIKVWRFEQFHALESQVFRAFTQGPVTPRSTRVFKTLSGNAMTYILDHVEPKSEQVRIRELVLAAAKKFPVSVDNPPFDLWSAEQAAHMTYRYELDWHEICKAYPGIALGSD